MKRAIILLLAGLWIGAQTAGAVAIGDESPASDQAKNKSAAADAAAQKTSEFKPPPGFVKKKRGKHTLYCRTITPMGTRIRTEQCYDERGMRDYMLALQENKRDIDRALSTCTNLCACGQPEAC